MLLGSWWVLIHQASEKLFKALDPNRRIHDNVFEFSSILRNTVNWPFTYAMCFVMQCALSIISKTRFFLTWCFLNTLLEHHKHSTIRHWDFMKHYRTPWVITRHHETSQDTLSYYKVPWDITKHCGTAWDNGTTAWLWYTPEVHNFCREAGFCVPSLRLLHYLSHWLPVLQFVLQTEGSGNVIFCKSNVS